MFKKIFNIIVIWIKKFLTILVVVIFSSVAFGTSYCQIAPVKMEPIYYAGRYFMLYITGSVVSNFTFAINTLGPCFCFTRQSQVLLTY